MSDHKIDQATVDTAIAAAGDALKEPGVAWITESALFERAYYFGLCFGLEEVVDDKLALNTLRMNTLVKTMSERGADNTFPSTTIGRDYWKLKGELERDESGSDDDREMIENLRSRIEEQDRRWRTTVQEVYRLLDGIQSKGSCPQGVSQNIMDDARRDQRAWKARLVHELERPLEWIALLETDHHMSKRLRER